MTDEIIHRDNFAYEPTVEVEQVWRITCDGGCGWEDIIVDGRAAQMGAQLHRDWHRRTMDAMEGGDGSDGVCAVCGDDRGPVLRRPRFGGLPYLVCRGCGEGA